MSGPKWDVSVGEGTGKYVELRVLVSVGDKGCKIIVEPVKGGQTHVEVAPHDEAGCVAGDVVAHLVDQGVAGFLRTNR